MRGSTAPQIRRAGIGDAPLVRSLTAAAYARWLDVLPAPPLPLLADYDEAVIAHEIDLLSVNGSVVALVETVRDGDALLIVSVAVAPEEQGRGHGRAMLAHAECKARRLGLERTRLYTNALMAENIALYRHLSYTIDSETTVGDRRHVNMSKRLAASTFRS